MSTEDLFGQLKFALKATEVRGILRLCQSQGHTIDYLTLAKALGMFSGGSELSRILGTIQEEDDKEGKGLLSSLVVGKNSGIPGKGYFENAREVLGRDIPDDEESERAFWVSEIEKLGLPKPPSTPLGKLKRVAQQAHDDLAGHLNEAIAIRHRAHQLGKLDVVGSADELERAIGDCISACERVYVALVAVA
jgi:hypothetical protein